MSRVKTLARFVFFQISILVLTNDDYVFPSAIVAVSVFYFFSIPI